MATGRALLTATEREVLSGQRGDRDYQATVRSRIRNRLTDLDTDLALIAAYEPELLTDWIATIGQRE